MPEPLSPALIHLILQYIVPPSQLSSPLPPHLISPSLRQRHHFLRLSPDSDPASYLAWPEDPASQLTAIRLLETFQKPVDDRLYASFPVRYTADPESAHAHVAITPDLEPGLRIIFQWSNPDGWKYHNLTLMPFPPDGLESIQDAMLFQPHHDFLAEPASTAVEDGGDDAYWDAYGHSEDDDDSPALRAPKTNSQSGTEDAYWAQYATVHGSGDSTLPSPRPFKQKDDASERIIVSYADLDIQPSEVYNPLQPPSPSTLSRRLAKLPPRSQSPPLLDESTSSSDTTTPSPQSHSEDLGLSPVHTIPPPAPSGALAAESIPSPHDGSFVVLPRSQELGISPAKGIDETRVALEDTIRSLYRFWKSGRRTCVAQHLTQDEERELFLDIVRQAVTEA